MRRYHRCVLKLVRGGPLPATPRPVERAAALMRRGGAARSVGATVRVLFVSSPGIGHIFPTVTTAWAFRAAGHDVLLATGGHHQVASQAGLPVVDIAPGVDFAAVFRNGMARSAGARAGQPDSTAGERLGPTLEFAAQLFARVSAECNDGTVRLAQRWRPDLVLYTPLQGAGRLAAATQGVPSVVHGIGFGQSPTLIDLLAERMSEDYQRFGVSAPRPEATLDLAPPSMRLADSTGWSMRCVPYNGGAVLPEWLLVPRERPRVVVTLGSVLPRVAGVDTLRPFVEAIGAVDAEFVLALGGASLSDLGVLPANIRPVDWTPLGALLRVSDAIVHHGGAGTTLTALDAGRPQLVAPQGADQFMNAAAVTAAGVGATVALDELDGTRITELLTDTTMRAAAEAISVEMATQPTPADLVPRLVALAG